VLASADGSIGQIPQNHFFMLEALRLQGTTEQKRFFYAAFSQASASATPCRKAAAGRLTITPRASRATARSIG